MKKAFYLDVETTGLHPWHNDIIQLACIVEINGEIQETYSANVQPFSFENIDEKALQVTGVTRKDLEGYTHPKIVYEKLTEILGKYVNKFEKTDKFTPVGYNAKFDCEFLHNLFKKNEDRFYGSWFNWKIVDPLQLLYIMDFNRKIDLPNYKLGTVCQHFGVPIQAHDALSDIEATRNLWYLLDEMNDL